METSPLEEKISFQSITAPTWLASLIASDSCLGPCRHFEVTSCSSINWDRFENPCILYRVPHCFTCSFSFNLGEKKREALYSLPLRTSELGEKARHQQITLVQLGGPQKIAFIKVFPTPEALWPAAGFCK